MRALHAVAEINHDGPAAGITTIVLHCDADATAWCVREADEAVRLGVARRDTEPTPPAVPGGPPDPPCLATAYLDEQAVLAALAEARADAVWTGWSPLGTSPTFAQACADAGVLFIGPSPQVLHRVADPAALRRLVAGLGVATTDTRWAPGSRSIEVDVARDGAGTTWAVGLRDCSVRREGEKVAADTALLPPEVDAAVRRAAARIVDELGVVGVVCLEFVTRPDADVAFLALDPRLQPEHAVSEVTTGVDLVKLQIELATGGALTGPPPVVQRHAADVRILAVDPERDFAPTSGRIALLRPPTGPGVRVDIGVTEGDLVAADSDPLLARVVAVGADRDQALSRLRRALRQSSFVIEGGTTSRSILLTALSHPDVRANRLDTGWFRRASAAGALLPEPDPVALLGAAIAAYDVDHAAETATFLATARRGRPEMPEHPGQAVSLRYRGCSYHLLVYRTDPSTYRVDVDGGLVDVGVEHLGPFERRLVVGEQQHRVMAVVDGAGMLVSVSGTTHRMTRDDGDVVRAEFPAFVVSVLVAPGDEVVTGQPVMVLESMKMESRVAAPVTGRVVEVGAAANEQVEIGAPLLRILPSALHLPAAGGGKVVDFSSLHCAARPATDDLDAVYEGLLTYLLGYDLDPATARDLTTRVSRLARDVPAADPRLLALEDAFLDVFADVAALYRPQREEATEAGSSQEYLLSYLQWLDVERAGIPESFQVRLQRALERYGVTGWARTPDLDEAVVRMFRSFRRVVDLVPVVTSILERRLHACGALLGTATPAVRALLDRLVQATRNRYDVVADLATDVRFHLFDEPVLEQVVARAAQETDGMLDALVADPGRADRETLVQRLVACPQPVRAALLSHWREASGDGRRPLLEVHARRYYRIRSLHDLRIDDRDGTLLCSADYEFENRTIHLVLGYAPFADLASTAASVARHLDDIGPQRGVVVDITTWRPGRRMDADAMAEQLLATLPGWRFGRVLHRLDLTVTSVDEPAPENARVQHFTFRQAPDGHWSEETLYRNLHPMLAKRLELWRLSNFDLERLLSPEDVYLFRGVAHDNPKDVRLFALAEVRDLAAVRDETGRIVSLPRLERMIVQSVVAMRDVIAMLPAKQQPRANRVILYVRPPWDIPAGAFRDRVHAIAPVTVGARLDKVVMRVSIPEGGQTRDAVLHLEGFGRRGMTVRERPPGDEPVRPLTEYRQKVLRAEQFGAPYPYEIVRMLAPPAGAPSDFPPGSFQEFDLDDGFALVPVDRPFGRNTANIVVGVITNHTEKVPEGMHRVAILSDPTRGLGNLAEPECRRINAALDLAARMHVPAEWFALSSGALIAMDSGTENMDWIARTLRALIEFTQAGHEVNIVVTGINVGGQPYWNAEATMLMHTKGILVMTPDSAMVLTGKQALDFSGGVSAEDNFGIGGYERTMGPNGQGQYWAPNLPAACELLLRHYEHTYVVPGERFPRRRRTLDPADRDVRTAPHAPVRGSEFTVVGDIFSAEKNAERKKPFDIRSVMRAVADTDSEPLERWQRWHGAESAVVWDAHVGGIPVLMLGLESRALARRGYVPADGPPTFTSGTLFPQSSRKTARAVNAASGNRPLLVLANLSGFDGSPESMRRWQLEYGAEIGRAVTNFRGPIVFVVISRYHGGAFVVFSKALNAQMEIAAVEGSFASVIGGAPAAAVVFAREVSQRTEKDPRVVALREQLAASDGSVAAGLRTRLVEVLEAVRADKLGEVAGEFDHIHSVQRALRVGSVDRIIAAADLRPYVIDALERRMALAPVRA